MVFYRNYMTEAWTIVVLSAEDLEKYMRDVESMQKKWSVDSYLTELSVYSQTFALKRLADDSCKNCSLEIHTILFLIHRIYCVRFRVTHFPLWISRFIFLIMDSVRTLESPIIEREAAVCEAIRWISVMCLWEIVVLILRPRTSFVLLFIKWRATIINDISYWQLSHHTFDFAVG